MLPEPNMVSIWELSQTITRPKKTWVQTSESIGGELDYNQSYGQNKEIAALWAAILDSAVPKYGINSKLVLLDFLTPKTLG